MKRRVVPSFTAASVLLALSLAQPALAADDAARGAAAVWPAAWRSVSQIKNQGRQ